MQDFAPVSKAPRGKGPRTKKQARARRLRAEQAARPVAPPRKERPVVDAPAP